MKKVYLPKLNSIRIENYSLYAQEPTFEFNFLNGISAIIGGNGIGKTTFVETILYCLAGHKKIYPVLGKKKVKVKERILDPNFFSSRMDDRFELNKKAKAFLNFDINSNNIVVGRSLYENEIVYLKVNNEEHPPPFNENIYNNIICELTGLSTFQTFDKTVRTFLFFDERRDNIAWDPETQDEILRIIFFDEEFLNEFQSLEDEVVHLDTKGRHKSEDRRVEKESLDDLLSEKEQLYKDIENQNNDIDLLNLYERKNLLEQEVQGLQLELEEKLEIYNQYSETNNIKIGERNEIVFSVESLNSEVSKLESKLYSSIYDHLPEYYVPLERTLVNEGRCQACGAKSKLIRETAINHKHNGECMICSSKIEIAEEYDPKVIEMINNLVEKRNELEIVVMNKTDAISEIQLLIKKSNEEIVNAKNILNDKHREIIYIDSLIAKKNLETGTDAFSQIIEVKQKKIEELTKEITKIFEERDIRRAELNKLHKRFTKVVVDLNKHLSFFFNKYASTFIGLNCELIVQNKTINRIPHVLYLPKISGSIREGISSVSESQRFFLDQAFRMAIIDYLQNTIPGFETFFITETPEGSLDIVYESQVAEMFVLFAKSSNNIIFTSNLNSSNFLQNVYQNMDFEERKKRTLNLLEKGNPTKLQKSSSQLLNIHEQLLGSEK